MNDDGTDGILCKVKRGETKTNSSAAHDCNLALFAVHHSSMRVLTCELFDVRATFVVADFSSLAPGASPTAHPETLVLVRLLCHLIPARPVPAPRFLPMTALHFTLISTLSARHDTYSLPNHDTP